MHDTPYQNELTDNRRNAPASPAPALLTLTSDRLLDAIPQIVWAATAAGVITYLNRRWYQYTESGEQVSPDTAFRQALHPVERDRVLAVWQSAIDQGEPFRLELPLLVAETTRHWLILNAVPVTDAKGQRSWVGTCSETTTLKQAELEACNLDLVELERLTKQQTAELEIADRQQATFLQALKESEERYRSLVVATSQMVWHTNADGQVTNPMSAWTAYTGQSEADVQGWGWLEAVHPDDRDRATQLWTQAVQSGTLYDAEYRIRGAEGRYRYFSVRGVPVLREDGSIREWVGFCRDISDRKQSEAALQSRADELARTTSVLAQTAASLETRNQELNQFAYVVSHDLKAPLRAIANLSEWLEEDLSAHLTDDTRHQMTLLRGRVHRLENLINGLLQYSRIGRTAVQPEQVDVGALLHELVDSLAPPPTFTIAIQPDLPTLTTDRLRLEQVFANLISNAIKHHDRADGQVRITAKVAAQAGRPFYEFSVTDDGQGIDATYHSKVFAIFQTLEARDKVENTGIGLSIVKKIVESQGGTVQVESQLGRGATFRFTWSAR